MDNLSIIFVGFVIGYVTRMIQYPGAKRVKKPLDKFDYLLITLAIFIVYLIVTT